MCIEEFPGLRQSCHVHTIVRKIISRVKSTRENPFPLPNPRPASNRISLTTNDLEAWRGGGESSQE